MLKLPEELRVLLTFLIVQGFKAFLNLFDKDLSGKAAAVVGALIAAFMVFLDSILALVPAEYIDTVSAVLGLLVAISSAFGLHYSYRNVVPR